MESGDNNKMTDRPSVLQFGVRQDSSMKVHHLGVDRDPKRPQVGVRIVASLLHLCTGEHKSMTNRCQNS